MSTYQLPHKAAILVAFFCFTSQLSADDTDKRIEQLILKLEQQQVAMDELRREVEILKARQKGTTKTIAPMDDPRKEAGPTRPLVVSSKTGIDVKLSGRVHRMLQYVDDGIDTELFHTDSDQGPTILKVDAKKVVNDSLTLGTTIELGLQQNRPLLVSQDDREKGIQVTGRVAELYANSTKYGKFSFGRGFMSSWYVPETDLSGTQFASLLSPGMLFGGLKFADPETGKYTETQVRNYFFDYERFLLKDRVRYDSIRFGGHTSLGGSVASDHGWDLALRSRHNPGDFSISAATSYQSDPFLDISSRWDAAISTRHDPSGINFTVGGFFSQTPDNRDPDSFVVKLGWLTNFIDSGATAFSVDWSKSHDIEVKDDSADSWGVFIMQNWDEYNLKVYAGIRHYEIDVPGKQREPITIIPFGVLMSF